MQHSLYKANNVFLGSLLYLFAYFNIAVIGLFVKFLPQDIHIGTIIFFQFSIPLLLSLPKILGQGLGSLKTQYYPQHFLRGISGILTFGLFFYSLSSISLTNAIVLRSTAPFWIPIILMLTHRLSVSKHTWGAIITGFIGIVLIIKPSIQGYFNVGTLFALGSGITIAISTLTVRKLSATEPTERTLFYFCLLASAASYPFVDKQWVDIDLHAFLFLCGIGVLMYLIEKALITALRYEKASTLAPVSYSAIIFSGIFEWLIWNKNLDAYDLLGASLIIFAGILTIHSSKETDMKLASPK